MESVDSPLEVLSLAATMVQDRCLPPSYEEARRVLPSTEWRKERQARDRLPEYDSSKSNKSHGEAPLDMTTRRSETDRGSPPSYSQSISQPGYRRNVPTNATATVPPPWPTVTKPCSRLASVEQAADSTQDLKKGGRKELITGSGTSDPDIDEHFRRSLGDVYQNVFCTSSKKDEGLNNTDSNQKSRDAAPTSGLSVDDHFAKALGETWLKLQAEASPPGTKTSKESRGPAPIKTVNGLTVAFPVKSNKKDSNQSEIARQRRRGLVTS